MGGLQEWKKKAAAASRQPPALEQTVRQELAAAAGAEYFDNRDPVYHITEDFQKTFDLMGTRKAAERSAMMDRSEMKEITPGLSGLDTQNDSRAQAANEPAAQQEAGTAQQRARASFLEQSSMDGLVEPAADPGDHMFLSRFSQVAFHKGTMAGAVLRGTGKMMLFSCLKRTTGQSAPINHRQRKLFEGGSQRRNVEGSPPDQVMFNRGQAGSAVGLVVDVLRDARRVVESMSELAGGTNMLKAGSGAETMQRIYPFLSDEREQALLREYRGKLEGAQDVRTKEILQHAITKTQALVEKKQQMKQRFIVTLRSIMDSANAALAAFTQPGFVEELMGMQEQTMEEPELPPDDGGDEPERERE